MEDYYVNADETSLLFLKILEQAIRDYSNLADSSVPIEITYFETARDFLFNPTYVIDWGDHEIGLEMILQYLHLDIDWFMLKLKKLSESI